MSSQYLWKSTLRGLNRIGDIFIPQNGDLPSFSQYGGAGSVDTVVAYLPKDDLNLLNIVLTIFSVLPTGTLRWIVRLMEESLDKTGGITDLLRQLDFGLRGVLFSCYYAGIGAPGSKDGARVNEPLDVIGYHINRLTN